MSVAAVVLVCFLAILTSRAESQCTRGDLRLVGGSGSYEGNVQICIDDEWGWVCDNSWNSYDAQVVCRQLGFSISNAVNRSYSYYGYGNGTIWLDHMYCDGSESKLIECSHAYGIGVTYCGYGEMAGVFCPFGGGCTADDIRLANFYTSSYGRSEGRVEVCHNNQWGTVCDDGWSSNDAKVACKQLGYDSTYFSYYSNSHFGDGSGNIWMNYLECSGSETSLFGCSSAGLGGHSCSHYEDAGVRCYSIGPSCTDGDVRLWSAYNTPSNEGVAQICIGSTWYSFCYTGCYVAKLVCLELGYPGAVATRSNGGFYYGYSYYNDNNYYNCYSYHTSLSQCYKYHYWWNSCGNYYNNLGVVCYDPSEGDDCKSGKIRLVDGETENEGRVEYCYHNSWVPVCSLNSYTASLMCQKLGYTQYTWGTIINDQRFGRSNNQSNLNYINCDSEHTDLDDCSVYNKTSSGCYISTSTCEIEYGLRCYNPGECTDGEVRLVDGVIEQEGRPEVCINGVWGSICHSSWNTLDGYVFCNSLGYDGPNPLIYYDSYFGSGYGPVVWSSVHCSGWEQNIHECSKSIYPSFTCYSSYVAGVLCKEGCKDGDVRLVGGDYTNEGTVEVCYDNLWGLVGDTGWTDGDAKVVCNQLGHADGIALPLHGSYYGKPNKVIHFKDVSCVGNEDQFADCTRTQLSISVGKQILNGTDVAGVDCKYDPPTEPPCIENPDIDPSDACGSLGTFRLINNSNTSTTEGRFEYCNGNWWTPVCTMDERTATVACRHLGHTQYSWGALAENGEYDTLLNYSLVQNITCSGSESSLSECTVYQPDDSCLPWCPYTNIGLRCYDTGTCEEGTVRIVDGIIEQEGRVEICVNQVWGSVCDKGWDKTDAHVVCQQMGYPELEPIVFPGSYFGDGKHPIVYSNLKCGGWENDITECGKDNYLDFSCSRSNVAGLLCGYDCEDGDIQLVGGNNKNEGTVEVCFDNLWGLIEEAGWSDKDAEIVCKQLGYEFEGSTAYGGSQYGKPAKTVHLTNVQCTGDEESIHECTQTSYSLQEGKNKLDLVEVAGVKCYVPTTCVTPPTGGTSCVNGEIQLTGDKANIGEGVLQYCYKGNWSPFCSLDESVATVVCRQLGFVDYDSVSIFTDGRFNPLASNTSLFENFTCSGEQAHVSLSDCNLADSCQSTCVNAIGIKCSVSANCEEGAVRLKDGDITQEGRIEVCANNIWGSICGDGFDFSDAYVVCKELGLGVSEPTVYTNSYFGDGNVPIVYSNMGCRGYENTVLECTKQEFGTFTCSRDKVAGAVCQDACEEGTTRLVGGREDTEGTVEICYFNLWGLVSVLGWNDTDASVVCYELGYSRDGAVSFIESQYGKPNKTVHLSNVACNGSESALMKCDAAHIPPDEGREVYMHVNVAGVSCSEIPPSATTELDPPNPTILTKTIKHNGFVVGFSITFILLVIMIISFVAYLLFKRFKGKIDIRSLVNAQKMSLSFLQEKEEEDEDPIVLSNDGADDEFEGIETTCDDTSHD